MSGITGPAVTAAVISLAAVVGGYLMGTRLVDPQLHGTAATQSAPAAPISGDALYAANCAGCHGTDAQGGLGPKLAGASRNWTLPVFAAAVLEGHSPEGRTLSPTMPRFRQVGFDGAPPSDAQLKALLGFLQEK